MRSRITTFTILMAVPLVVCGAQAPSQTIKARSEAVLMDTLTMNTWSVVGVDPKTGDVGVAMASCVEKTLADALASLVPGKGAAATQAGFDVGNRNRVFEALKSGANAAEVIRRATDPKADTLLDRRQYGVLTISNGKVEAARLYWKADARRRYRSGARDLLA